MENDFNWDNCDMKTNGEYYFLKCWAKTWEICLDIGANEGSYAQSLMELNPNCRVICFEPNPVLVSRITEKGIKEVYNTAVGADIRPVIININTKDPGLSSVFRKNTNTRPLEVPQITIDDFVLKNYLSHIDFIKIDTEGSELAVLRGAKNFLACQAIDMIQFEYGGTYLDAGITLKEVYELLDENYIIYHIYPSELKPFKYSETLETYQYSNWAAVSRQKAGRLLC